MNSKELESCSSDINGSVRKVRKLMKENNFTDAFELIYELEMVLDGLEDELSNLQNIENPPICVQKQIKSLEKKVKTVNLLFGDIGYLRKAENL